MILLPGVYSAKKKDGTLYYRASITYKNKHISLGSFNTNKEAHDCYLHAKVITTSTLGVMDYTMDLPISFEKWVILINFRDHSYYFKTPIYLSKKYFTYYLSNEEELSFDIEDLFYYSTHRINKRDGYYYVNDYGMQVNILSRYHILNHSTRGIDYEFIDGNNTNFRYDNIEVINPYYGVKEEHHPINTQYKATININGSYIIGRYSDLTTAAIAYNKAIDFLHNYDISSKNFPKNYINDMDRDTYLNIYKNIKISKKILALFDRTSI